MNISWGIEPMRIDFISNQKELFESAMRQALKTDLITEGDMIILTASIPTGNSGKTNMLKMHRIGDEVIGS